MSKKFDQRKFIKRIHRLESFDRALGVVRGEAGFTTFVLAFFSGLLLSRGLLGEYAPWWQLVMLFVGLTSVLWPLTSAALKLYRRHLVRTQPVKHRCPQCREVVYFIGTDGCCENCGNEYRTLITETPYERDYASER